MTDLDTPRRLPLRDTPHAYGLVTRLLHWGMALLILMQFTGMGLRLVVGRNAVTGFFVGLHQPVGTLLAVLIALRIVWALVNLRSRPHHAPGLVGRAAVVGHGVMYLLLLAIPTIALLRAWGSERAFAPFGFQIFAPRTPEIAWTQDLAGALHGELAWLLLVLIAGHVVMASLHEAMWRDGTVARMAGRWRNAAPIDNAPDANYQSAAVARDSANATRGGGRR